MQEIHCLVAFHMPPTGDLAPNPGMCPDWESNWQPFCLQAVLNPLTHPSQSELQVLKAIERERNINVKGEKYPSEASCMHPNWGLNLQSRRVS